MRLLAILSLVWCFSAPQNALADLVRLDPENSFVRDTEDGVSIVLSMADDVPWRVFTMEAPRRLVIDLAEVAWPDSIPLESDIVLGLGMGNFAPAWSRMVLELGSPMAVTRSDLKLGNGTPTLAIDLVATTPARFATNAGSPDRALIGAIARDAPPAPLRRDPLRVVLLEGAGLGENGACFVARLGQAIDADVGLSTAHQSVADVALSFGPADDGASEGTAFVEVMRLALKEAGGFAVTGVTSSPEPGASAHVVASYFPSDGQCALDGTPFGDRTTLDGLVLGLQRWAQIAAAEEGG